MSALSRLKEARVRLSERRFEVGEVIYSHGEPDRYLYFLTEDVLKLYKRYGGHKETIVTLLEEVNVFGVPDLRARGAHRESSEAVISLGSLRCTSSPWNTTCGVIPSAHSPS